MRRILAALVGFGIIGAAAATPASADVYVQTPGVTVAPAEPYWRQHENWRAQREFREEQYRRQAWIQNHCVRDWNGQAYCRQ